MTNHHKSYSSIKEATQDVLQVGVYDRKPLGQLNRPVLQIVLPVWTNSLSGFQANASVSPATAHALEQIEQLYYDTQRDLESEAEDLTVGRLNEHDPGTVLFMVLFRTLQYEFATKMNLNPHKMSVLLQHRYSVE